MRDASAKFVNMTCDRLCPRSRGTHDPDRSAADAVGESQTNAVDDGGTAVRAHDKQTFFTGGLFQGNFIFKRNIIAIKKNLFVQFKGFTRYASSITTGNRDQDPIGLRQLFDRSTQTAGTEIL